jgi:hypothetical protein
MINFNNDNNYNEEEQKEEKLIQDEFYGINYLVNKENNRLNQKHQINFNPNESINNTIITTTDTEKSQFDIMNSSYLFDTKKEESNQSSIPNPQNETKDMYTEFADYFMNL